MKFQTKIIRRNNRRVGGEREVDAWIRHQVGLKLRQIHVQRAIETQGSGNRRDHLGDQAVQVGISRPKFTGLMQFLCGRW